MKRFTTYFFALLLAIVTASSASAMAKPFDSTRLVLASECLIDYEASVYWTGNAEDSILQIIWLVEQLPERCYERKCVFTNIDHNSYVRIRSTRFLEKWKDNPELWAIGEAVTAIIWEDCRLAQNPMISAGGSGARCPASAGNNSSVLVSGGNNAVSVGQRGCNSAVVVIDGDNIQFILRQIGRNSAVIKLIGNDIKFVLEQNGNNHYSAVITSGEHHVVQNSD